MTITQANSLVDARQHRVHALDQPPIVNVRLDVRISNVVEPIEVKGGNELFLALRLVFFELLLYDCFSVLGVRGEGAPVSSVRSAG